MSYKRHGISRRRFLTTAAGMAAIPALTPAGAFAAPRVAANDRITVGAIGLGGQGFGDMMAMLHQPDTQIVALCDVDSKHYRDKAWGEGRAYGLNPAADVVKDHYAHSSPGAGYRGLKLYSDFREVCNDPSIDAVIVATPDHWHALCTLEALRNGKDVYCEKPLTHLFHEGQAVYREAARQNAVFQVGSQQRSNERFRHAVELVLNGHIGKIHTVEVGLCPGYDHPMGDTTIKPPPDHLNYDFWCGPSEKLPYMRARSHRFWRGHHDYGGGELMDWIGHHNDIAHWGMGMDDSGPTSVEAVDWIYADTDIYNVPYLYTVNCEYVGGIKTSISTNFEMGPKWIGDKGWVHVNRSKLEASNPEWVDANFDPGPIKVYVSNDHKRNFLDCVRSRKACVAPAETGHRSVTPGHLGFVSHKLGRKLKWDPAKEVIVGDDEAQKLLMTVNYRKPWTFKA